MFTQKCLIRSNTTTLRGKLKDLGYRIYDSDNASFIVTGLGFYEDFEDDCVMSGNRNEIISELILSGTIDCGTNEEMFLALAALRDDSDRGQLFVKKDSFDDNYFDRWYLCHSDKISDELISFKEYHKATPKEIVEHFKESKTWNKKIM